MIWGILICREGVSIASGRAPAQHPQPSEACRAPMMSLFSLAKCAASACLLAISLICREGVSIASGLAPAQHPQASEACRAPTMSLFSLSPSARQALACSRSGRGLPPA